MKILINSTTSFFGGGVQIGVAFVNYVINKDINFDFICAITKPIFENLPENIKNDKRLVVFNHSPALPFKGQYARRELLKIERSFNPNLIYSLSFPSYVKFNTREIGRYTNPWEIFPAKLAWKKLSLFQKLMRWLKNIYRLFWAKRASYFETQTEYAKQKIVEKFSLSEDQVKVVSNSLNPIFANEKPLIKENNENVINIFSLAADHPHKNLLIIPEVARIINQSCDKGVSFILTLPNSSKTWSRIIKKAENLSVSNQIINVGPLSLKQCVDWYNKIDIVFQPTLLEVFSANYLEAMKMKKPIITSNLPFAKEVCGEGAIYFKPDDPNAAAKAILTTIKTPNLCHSIVEKATKQLSNFPNYNNKHKMVVDWISSLV